jgi:hypothetical protein
MVQSETAYRQISKQPFLKSNLAVKTMLVL